MIVSELSTRMITLAVAISTVLLGAVAAQADPRMDPSPTPPVKATPPTDDRRPAATPASPDAGAVADPEPTEVGSEKSNVDKDSSSGSYYPYSAGTVGDDPAEPTSTSVPADAGDTDPGPTDQWGAIDSDGDGYLSRAELAKAAPALSASFDAMDVDGDAKLTHGEYRTWRESRETRMDADQDSRPSPDVSRSSDRPPPDGAGD